MNASNAPTRPDQRALLFTAFEPSGDEHAAAVIAQLRRRHPALPVFAWGGARMEAAGATIVERTGEDALMGVPGWKKIREHQRINERVARWLDAHHVQLHVPVDSPAANFPICELVKARGIRIVHLVAPQIWAWGRWRIHKLRRLTDLVLCLLPFEERFFTRRGVPARFIGHMLFDVPLEPAGLDRRAAEFPQGEPRIAIMPGSRPDELRRNFPLLLHLFQHARARHPHAAAVIAATNERVGAMLTDQARVHFGGSLPECVRVIAGQTDAVIRWCTLALVKSGTVTLQVAKQGKPMVILYKKSNPVMFLLARTVLSTKHYALPNVVAARRIVPEFVPHFGSPRRIELALDHMLDSPEARAVQQRELAAIVEQFRGRHAAAAAADAIEEIAGLRPTAPAPAYVPGQARPQSA